MTNTQTLDICKLHNCLIDCSYEQVEKLLVQFIAEKEPLAAFACLAAAHNKQFVCDVLPFFMNAVFDTCGTFRKHHKFIDKVIDYACAYNTSSGPLVLRSLQRSRLWRNKNDHAYVYLRRKALRRWSLIFMAVVVKKMWYSWLQWRLRPDGPYIKRLCKKWQKMA